MQIEISKSPDLEQLTLGAVELQIPSVDESDAALRAWSDGIAQQRAASSDEQEPLRQKIRQMLRHGHFKASGRSKPAQEYLLRCATENSTLPCINAPVDILNTVSLDCGLPISLLSISKCSGQLHIRRGLAGETYVFNTVGQELDLTNLVVVCDASVQPSRPVGSPIKDSMAGKIEPSDKHLIAIVYAPTGFESALNGACTSLIEDYQRFINGTFARQLEVR